MENEPVFFCVSLICPTLGAPPPPPLLKGGAHLQSSIALYREVMVVGVLLLRQSGGVHYPNQGTDAGSDWPLC